MPDYSRWILLEGKDHERFLELFRTCAKYLYKFESFKKNAEALVTQFEHAEFYVEKPLSEGIPVYIYIKVNKTSTGVKPLRVLKNDIEELPIGVDIPATEKHPYVDDVTGKPRRVGSSVGTVLFWFDESDDYKWVDLADLNNYGVEDLDWPESEQILYWLNNK